MTTTLDPPTSAAPPAPEPPSAPTTPGGQTHHIEVMDGLRGIAVLMVVFFHYWFLSFWIIPASWLPAGNLEVLQFAGSMGVELFFFISAFCLFYPHAKAMFGLGAVPRIKHFYYRRAIKIVPSYWLSLFVLAVFFASLYPVTWHYGTWADVGIHLLFLHNMTDDTRSSFDLVYWSLGVEVQFYYLFPLIAKVFRRYPWLTAAGMIAIATLYRGWMRHRTFASFDQFDNQLPGFFDLFACGMLTAYLVIWIRQRGDAVRRARYAFTVVGISALAVLVLLFQWYYDSSRWQDNVSSVWRSVNRQNLGLVFLFISVGSAFAINFWRRLLANRVLVFFSTISYNLYLWHVPVALIIKNNNLWHSRTNPPMGDATWRWSYTLVSLTASVVVSAAINYLFERPLLRRGVRGCLSAILGRLGVSWRPAGAATATAPAVVPAPALVAVAAGSGPTRVTANGAGLNGAGLNGAGLNGAGLNGAGLNGAGLNGAGLNGGGLNGAGLNGAGPIVPDSAPIAPRPETSPQPTAAIDSSASYLAAPDLAASHPTAVARPARSALSGAARWAPVAVGAAGVLVVVLWARGWRVTRPGSAPESTQLPTS